MPNFAREGQPIGGTSEFMDKAEILHQLKTTRQINTFTKTSLWREAFNAYHLKTGVKLSMGCSKCFAAVKEWLEK